MPRHDRSPVRNGPCVVQQEPTRRECSFVVIHHIQNDLVFWNPPQMMAFYQ